MLNKVLSLQELKLRFANDIRFFILLIILIAVFLSGCSTYEKYYNYYSEKTQEIFYSRKIKFTYISKFSSNLDKGVSLFYGYFLPDLKTSDIKTVVLLDDNFNKINSILLKSIDKKAPIINFDQILFGNLEYPLDMDVDFIGLNIAGTNLIILKKNKYDSIQSLTGTYIAEVSHVLLFRNSTRNLIQYDNKFDYLNEFFSEILGDIYMPDRTDYSFDAVRTKLDDLLKNVYINGYPDTLKNPINFRSEKLYAYLDDFLCLFHIMIENESSYEKFKKTMVELFTKQYYTVNQNTIDRPFIDNYGKTLDELIASWSPKRM